MEYSVTRCVNVIIVEPRTLLREGLVSLLHDSDFRVILAVPTPDKVPQVALERASLLIFGASNEPAETSGYFERNSSAARSVKIVVIAEVIGKAVQPDILKCLATGADCCIFNVRSRDVLLRSLHLVVLGQRIVVFGHDSGALGGEELETKPVSSMDFEVRANSDSPAHLSTRELEILSFVVAGESNKEIARTCHLAESTVKIHLKTILRKIHVRNRTQAAIWAVQHTSGSKAALPVESVIINGDLKHSPGAPILNGPRLPASRS